MMQSIVLWLWEIRDASAGRWHKTRYRMTEQDARERFGVDARRLDWSREVRDGDPEANYTSAFQRGSGRQTWFENRVRPPEANQAEWRFGP